MFVNEKVERRSRGRPQVRCDDDTKEVIVKAANAHFHEGGFSGSGISSIAQAAGVSTKTLYRLFPNKEDLFASVISARIDHFVLELDQTLATSDLRSGIEKMLSAYGMLTLSEDTVGMTRLVVAESDRFPELAKAFYERAIVPTNNAMESWLRTQSDKGLLYLKDPHEACGMLRGMMIMEPQRSMLFHRDNAPDASSIEQRAKVCADIFLTFYTRG